MDLYVVTPDGTTVASRVHAAVLICVKTAAILGAVLALGPLKEEDYMHLVKQSLERKDHLVTLSECEHSWPCYGKPAIIFHDRGKIFTSERARQVLVDRLGIITEQAPPYAPSAKGTVETLFGWMTERFERRLPGTSYGVHDAETAAQAGGMTNEEEQALGDQLFTALGLPLRGHWHTRKPKLMGHLYQYGTECLIVDDAHDLSFKHLMLLHDKRKTNTPNTGRRWAMGKTTWEVVGGERT
jgi:transposase InsO family protein